MALGDRHVMALMSSLDHLPGLTSIDIADNRYVVSLLAGLRGLRLVHGQSETHSE